MEELLRPPPPRSVAERVRAWIDWFGYGRILGSAIATLIVCAGAFWLVRVPPPPTEASLPLASTTSSIQPADAVTHATGSASTDTTAPDDGSPFLVVHVAGAVTAPGVYELATGSRVDGAIAAAGGPTPEANPNALNLAAPLIDGSRIYVPQVGEEIPIPVIPVGTSVDDGSAVAVVIDVNTATAAELEELPGIGPATALAIVSEREDSGPFLSVDDLDRVPGIGPAKIEAIRGLVTS